MFLLNILKSNVSHFQEFGSTALDFVEEDPITLKEVHEHMIRSPPPTSCWPHGKKKDNPKKRLKKKKRIAYLLKLKLYLLTVVIKELRGLKYLRAN